MLYSCAMTPVHLWASNNGSWPRTRCGLPSRPDVRAFATARDVPAGETLCEICRANEAADAAISTLAGTIRF